MEIIKIIHVLSAYITGLGFLLRGILALRNSSLLAHRTTKTIPHIIDSCLLASGLTMMVSWAMWPTIHAWLLAKIIALLVYIFFGLVMLRWGTSVRNRWLGLSGGFVVYIYIVGVAHSKSVLSVFSVI